MFFLNLSAGEFLGLLGVLGGTITALYFLDRSKRRKIVSTLQFWVSAATASEHRSRKKVNQPWSLLLQLLSLALLLLAIAQLQWGTRAAAGRDHVLLVDTSSWSGARGVTGTALQAELGAAENYIASLPPQDRVLLVRADALITPATVFTADREQTRTVLRETVSSLSSLDLRGALTYAEQAQRWSGGVAGEIVYIGPRRVDRTESADAAGIATPRNLRVVAVPVNGANTGIRSIDVRRGEADPNSWYAQITLLNYGGIVQPVRLRTQFAGTRFAARSFNLSPHQEVTAEYNFVTNTEGQLTAEIDSNDVLEQDNRASLQLPGNNSYAVTVYTRRADLLKPLLTADRRISATFLDPSQVSAKPKADLVILDGVSSSQSFSEPSIWINPPPGGSPFHVRAVVAKAAISKWNSSALMAAGLQARAERIAQAKILDRQSNDVVLASLSANGSDGPVILLRPNSGTGKKMAAIGFDPLDSHLRFTVTTPLLFANLLEWMAPESVRAKELRAGRVGSASVSLEPDENAADLKVTSDSGVALPFTVHEQTLQLFVNKPTIAHVRSGGRDRVLSLTLPDVAEAIWTPSVASVVTGLPAFASLGGAALDLWQWLACLGALGLLAEWLLFGRSRSLSRIARKSASPSAAEEQPEEELVAR